MTPGEEKPILNPALALARYRDELTLQLANGRVVILPGVIGTVFFERGSKPEVRRHILACFDRFEQLFGEHLKGGKDTDLGKFTQRTAKGLEKIRSAILDTDPSLKVSVVRSSAVDQDTATEYEIKLLTNQESPIDFQYPGSSYVLPKGSDGGSLSYLKFHVPMELITTVDGLALYESFLRFVCEQLPVRGGYGGFSAILPYSFHRYLPQEWALAERFSGLEIDAYAFTQKNRYVMRSYLGESPETADDFYPYLKPGAKVQEYGFIKGVNWYTLLGDPFVERFGGEAVLRAALHRPDIKVERTGQCVLVRAGEFPRLGAPEEGPPEPYVFVNSVLRVLRDPAPDSLHTHVPHSPIADIPATRSWQARFDLPGAAPIPPAPVVVPAVHDAERP